MKRHVHILSAGLLLLLGVLQMSGDLLHLPVLKGLGAASGAWPAPKVFSADRNSGLEMFSTQFSLTWTDHSGAIRQLPLTPSMYARLRGPYNRRNAYGAAMAYGPVLATHPHLATLFRSVASHALCGDRPLLRELGVDTATIASAVGLRWTPRDGIPAPVHVPLYLEVPCDA